MEIQVIGGGVLGVSAALALAEEGHDVTLREQHQLGAGATGRAAGILSTMTWDDMEYALIAETRGLVGRTIALAAGMVPEARHAWRPLDSILIASGDSVAPMDAIQDRLERHGEEPERLGFREAASTYPGVSFVPGEEVLVAMEDGVIDADAFMAAMRARLEMEAVTVEEGVQVGPADLVGPTVVAGGAWTRGLLRRAGVALPLQAFRTQIAALDLPGAERLPVLHDAVHGFYARPESEDTLWVGDGTRLEDHDPDHFDARNDPRFKEDVAAAASTRFEAGPDARLRTGWAGLCVATPDRHPLCGAVPDRDDLWVLTGDNGFGLMRGLALGQRLADAVDGRPDARLVPGRFDDMGSGFTMREGFSLP